MVDARLCVLLSPSRISSSPLLTPITACLPAIFFFPLSLSSARRMWWCGKWQHQHPARACERQRVKTEWLPVVKLAVAAPPVHEGVTCADAATVLGWQLLLHFLPFASVYRTRCCPLPIVDAFLWTAYRTCSLIIMAWACRPRMAVQCSVDRRAVEMACGGTIATARQ